MTNKTKQKPTYKMVGKNLVLLADTVFDEILVVKGDIICKNGKHSLTVNDDIRAKNINVYNLFAYDIRAKDISAFNIIARDIDANDIYARNIEAVYINAYNIQVSIMYCEQRIKKTPDVVTIATVFIENRFKIERKERMPKRTD